MSTLEPLPGALIRDFKRCGRPTCKCAGGELHGPYFVRVRYEGGQRRKAYVKASDVPHIEAAIRLFDLEGRLAKLRSHMAQRVGKRQSALLAGIVEELEAESDELRRTPAL